MVAGYLKLKLHKVTIFSIGAKPSGKGLIII
jgi:hypothetical protein